MKCLQYYAQYGNKRTIAIYGSGYVGELLYKKLHYQHHIKDIVFFDKKNKELFEVLDCPVRPPPTNGERSEFYVIIASRTKNSIAEIANTLISSGFVQYEDWCLFEDENKSHTEDYRIGGVAIGKYTELTPYFVDLLQSEYSFMISSIGRYCSFNETAMVNANHRLDTIWCGNFPDSEQISVAKNKYYASLEQHSVKIGNDVWIGANAFINASNCHSIGDGAVIGAGAVITKDVPPYAVVVGVPGRIIRYRYTARQIECLLKVRWWDWTHDEIDSNAELLFNPKLFFDKFLKGAS
jgi:aminocyclitol acetyltransferase